MQFTRVVFTAIVAAFAGSSFLVAASPIPAPAPAPVAAPEAEAEAQTCQMLNSCI
ncbi:hypothetical protein H1R20_g8898, partial [Candolleomyces eurysporus]|uniref:Uncharacterized protein n=2 Tax=Candolleomyces TaxID=2791032 RepID=A0A4Q2DA69_9AGAR